MNKANLFKHLKGATDIEKLTYLRSIGLPKNGPIFTQIKYNGVHVRLEVTNTQATFYTKPSDKFPDGKPYRKDYFKGIFDELVAYLISLRTGPAPVNYYGEFLIPHTRLQDIAGEVAVNRNEIGEYAKKGLYVVFYDRFDTGDLIVNQPFSQRYKTLKAELGPVTPTRWRVAWCEATSILGVADTTFKDALEAGEEGVMYRVDPCYLVENTPTWHFIKRKKIYDMEGRVIQVYEGKGKHEGCLGSLEVRLSSGSIVKVGRGEGWTEAKLAKLWADRDKLIGQTVTFSYEEMSKTGIPLRNQLIAIRNYES